MKCPRSLWRGVVALTALLALAANAAGPTVAHASPLNGELCSVQTFDQSVRASVYAYPLSASPNGSQLAHAGAWCTNQINVPGWIGADSHYDSWDDQDTVCIVHFEGDDLAIGNFADLTDDAALAEAVQGCKDIAGGDPSVITWYP
jgi:hypothetical protein